MTGSLEVNRTNLFLSYVEDHSVLSRSQPDTIAERHLYILKFQNNSTAQVLRA